MIRAARVGLVPLAFFAVAVAVAGAGAFAREIAPGDRLRVEVSLRGRTSPYFRGIENAKFGVAAGTKVEVVEYRPYRSGAAAVRVKLLMGPNAGKTVWVYQNREGTYLSNAPKQIQRADSPVPVVAKPVVTVKTVPPIADCPPEPAKPAAPPEVKTILSAADRVVAAEFTKQAKLSDQVRCQPLDVGGSRKVDVAGHNSPTGIEARYKLTRVSESEYEVKLNPVFVDRRNAPEADGVLNQKFRKGVQACYNVANRAMFGPGGQKLKLVLAAPGQDMVEVPQVEIGIYSAQGGPVTRQNSAQYKEDIDCPTLIHETMHLLGLCDEYKEEWMGKKVDAAGNVQESTDGSSKYRFDCRTIGPEVSIMSNHARAFMQSMLHWQPFIYTCECGSAACLKRLETWEASSGECPRGAWMPSSRIAELEGIDRPTGSSWIGPKKKEFVSGGDRFGPSRSLLHSGHFNAIVHPGCAVNEDFYGCSAFAYTDARGPDRQGCGETLRQRMQRSGSPDPCPDCDRVPAACSQPSWVGEAPRP